MDQQSLMIPSTEQKDNLSHLPRRTLRRVEDLDALHILNPAMRSDPALSDLVKRYTIGVTADMAELINRDQLDTDPIGLQFIPDTQELHVLPEEESDPIGDYNHAPLKALVHRHPDRVLLKPTHACAVYCRFCFRREMIGPHGDSITTQDLRDALDYIREHDTIREVILTGGDPFVLSAERLRDLIQSLSSIPHVQWIRAHTRVPIVQPDKITTSFLKSLETPKNLVIAIHANHAREFTPSAQEAVAALHAQGVMLVSQSVLLKHINDTVENLATLMETFVSHHIKPYYLHHPDLTRGTSHFRVSLEEGMALIRALRSRVSGLCIPHYVLDIPGGVAKIPVTSDYITPVVDQVGYYHLTAPDGSVHLYRDLAVAS